MRAPPSFFIELRPRRLASLTLPLAFLPLSTLNEQLRRRKDGGLAAVLPAALGGSHAASAGRPLLRPRAADVDRLRGVCRPFARSPVGAVSGRLSRRGGRRRKGREPRAAALDDERRG